jgi:hypothetical protein
MKIHVNIKLKICENPEEIILKIGDYDLTSVFGIIGENNIQNDEKF